MVTLKEFYTKEIKKLYEAVGWDEQKFRYTGTPKGVQWIRIHKLPDFTYFNHSQHVAVGGLECQKCHGEVQQWRWYTSTLLLRWGGV